ncbi:hypothetical protein [Microbispora sp. NPDC049125]|uniref:hypothetical protein n=1 Tax=Microbispora sp. NPDC049125 TaxID=3154929 RepID=UPI0034663A5C
MRQFLRLFVCAFMLTALGITTVSPASAAPKPLWGTVIGSNEDGRLEVIAFSSDDTLYTNYQQVGGRWSGWQARAQIPEGVVTQGPIVRSNKDGRMEIFAGTADGRLYHMWQVAKNSGWSGWAQLGKWPMTTGLSVTVNLDGRIEAFLSDGRDLWSVYQLSATSGTGWGSADLGTPAFTYLVNGPVAAAQNGDGRLEVFAVGCGIASPYDCGIPSVYHKWQNAPGRDWSGWAPMSHCNDQTLNSIATAKNEDGRLEFLEIVPTHGYYNGDLCAQWQLPGPTGGWHAFENRGNGQIDTTAPVAIANDEDGRIEAFTVNSNGTIQQMWQLAKNGGWSGWNKLGTLTGFTRSGLGAGRNKDGRLEVVAIRGAGQPYHIWQTVKNGGWSDWAPLEAG